jgi:hypothetical protein
VAAVGWYNGLMTCGSCCVAVTWAAQMKFLVNAFRAASWRFHCSCAAVLRGCGLLAANCRRSLGAGYDVFIETVGRTLRLQMLGTTRFIFDAFYFRSCSRHECNHFSTARGWRSTILTHRLQFVSINIFRSRCLINEFSG